MAQQIINVGSAPNDGTGDTLRNSQIKVNANVTELYANKAESSEVLSNDETTYTAATLPLAGTELALVEQGGTFKKVAVSEFGGGVTPKRSYFAEWKLGGAMAASTSWYQQAVLIGLRGIFTANAALTPSNSFANGSVQTPCFVLPFQAKIKSVTVRGWCNGVNTATIRTCVVKSDNAGSFLNPAIIGDVSYLLNIPSINSFSTQFTSTGLTFTTLPALTQIRIFNFNNNQNTPLQDTIISVEFEEVI